MRPHCEHVSSGEGLRVRGPNLAPGLQACRPRVGAGTLSAAVASASACSAAALADAASASSSARARWTGWTGSSGETAGASNESASGRSGAWSFATTASHDFLSRISPTGTPSIAVSARPNASCAGLSCSAALTRATPVLRSKDSSMPKGPWKMRSIAVTSFAAVATLAAREFRKESKLCAFFKVSGAGRLRAARACTGLTAA